MITRRSWLVYGLLGSLWALLVAWQVIEHVRVHRAAQNQLIERGRDISTTCGSLMRAVRFFGVISKERLETALERPDVLAWREVTHSLKGAANGIGAFALGEAAADAESVDPAIESRRAVEAFHAVKRCACVVSSFIDAYLGR